jgi:hypothetical protein
MKSHQPVHQPERSRGWILVAADHAKRVPIYAFPRVLSATHRPLILVLDCWRLDASTNEASTLACPVCQFSRQLTAPTIHHPPPPSTIRTRTPPTALDICLLPLISGRPSPPRLLTPQNFSRLLPLLPRRSRPRRRVTLPFFGPVRERRHYSLCPTAPTTSPCSDKLEAQSTAWYPAPATVCLLATSVPARRILFLIPPLFRTSYETSCPPQTLQLRRPSNQLYFYGLD